ncbi:MAG: hypothetical protein ABIC95_06760 [archaeon]
MDENFMRYFDRLLKPQPPQNIDDLFRQYVENDPYRSVPFLEQKLLDAVFDGKTVDSLAAEGHELSIRDNKIQVHSVEHLPSDHDHVPGYVFKLLDEQGKTVAYAKADISEDYLLTMESENDYTINHVHGARLLREVPMDYIRMELGLGYAKSEALREQVKNEWIVSQTLEAPQIDTPEAVDLVNKNPDTYLNEVGKNLAFAAIVGLMDCHWKNTHYDGNKIVLRDLEFPFTFWKYQSKPIASIEKGEENHIRLFYPADEQGEWLNTGENIHGVITDSTTAQQLAVWMAPVRKTKDEMEAAIRQGFLQSYEENKDEATSIISGPLGMLYSTNAYYDFRMGGRKHAPQMGIYRLTEEALDSTSLLIEKRVQTDPNAFFDLIWNQFSDSGIDGQRKDMYGTKDLLISNL